MSQKRQDRVEFLKPEGQEQQGLHDLSESGAAFVNQNALNEGSQVALSIADLDINARVIYSREQVRGYKTGVQFESIDEAKKTALSSLVDKFSRGMPINFAIRK